jgi:DNA-binding CsgD family transcriptional regulator
MDAAETRLGWEELFWVLFRESSNPVTLLDEDRRVVEMNDAGLRLMDRSRGDLIGTPWRDLVAPTDQEGSDRRWVLFLENGSYVGTCMFRRPADPEFVAHVAARMTQVGNRRLAVLVILPQAASDNHAASPLARTMLSPREREVVTQIALGLDTVGISQQLHISPETVRTHVRNAMGKLDVHTRAELVAVVLATESAVSLPRSE